MSIAEPFAGRSVAPVQHRRPDINSQERTTWKKGSRDIDPPSRRDAGRPVTRDDTLRYPTADGDRCSIGPLLPP